MIRVAVVGYGMAAQTFHLPLLRSNPAFEISAIVSRQTVLDLSAYPQARQFADIDGMLAANAADLVVITAPNDLHHPMAKQCLNAGKHVVLEKPMVLTVAQGQELQALAQAKGLVLSVFQNRRWDGDFLTLKALIARGEVGKVRYFAAHWDRFRPQYRNRWRENAGAGTGIWYDLGPHLLDQTLQLFGAPQALHARLRALRDGSPTVDYAHVQLHYPDFEVLLHTSPFNAAPNPRYMLQGDQGTYVKYGLDCQEMQLKNGILPDDAAFGIEDSIHDGIFYSPDGEARRIAGERGQFPAYYRNIAAAIESRAELAVKVEEVLITTALIDLAMESDKLGQTLPFQGI